MSGLTKKKKYVGPYASLREYLEALEKLGRVLHINDVDQDQYEATGFMYRLMEKYSAVEAPVVSFDRIKTQGQWMQGPVLGNLYGRWEFEALAMGIEPTGNLPQENYKLALDKVESLATEKGTWKTIKPVAIANSEAPSKEIKYLGKDVDLLQFPFIQTNPADGGCYINTGNVILTDEKYGRNVGTYRCQVKDSSKISINPEKNQHGWNFLMEMRARGEKSAPVAIVLGSDPIVFALSSSKVSAMGEDELEIAGGFLGEPLEVVKCETNSILVPANVEMIIEGEIPLNRMEPEGPFGEMYGYMGARKSENFFMDVTAITHRENPLFVNQFSGITRGFLTSPIETAANLKFKQQFENFLGLHYPLETPGFCFVNINKNKTREAVEIGRAISKSLKIAKITVVFDADVDIHNTKEVMHALGSRWQPHDSTEILKKAPGMGGDPSAREHGFGSRIIIDATRQTAAEGGPKEYAKMNRQYLEEGVPRIFERVDKKYGHLL
jgi:UbiD family decarboxylase